MSIPDWVGSPEEYWLPPGIHITTLENVKDALLFSDARRSRWIHFESYLLRLLNWGFEPVEAVIDGSFVTKRCEPNDVDGFVVIPRQNLAETYNSWSTKAARKEKDAVGEFEAIQTYLRKVHLTRSLTGVHMWVLPEFGHGARLVSDFTLHFSGVDQERDPANLLWPGEKGILRVKFPDVDTFRDLLLRKNAQVDPANPGGLKHGSEIREEE